MNAPTETLRATCTECGHEFECASPLRSTTPKPKPGDLTFCIACGASYLFTEGLGIKPVDLGVLLKDDPQQLDELRAIQTAIVHAWHTRDKRPRTS